MTTQTKARAKRDPHAPDPRIQAAVVHKLGENPYRYEVLSASQGANDVWHAITYQPDGTLSCSCPAHLPCWHVAAVRPKLLRDLEKQRDADLATIRKWGYDLPHLSSARYGSDLLMASSEDGLVFGHVGVV